DGFLPIGCCAFPAEGSFPLRNRNDIESKPAPLEIRQPAQAHQGAGRPSCAPFPTPLSISGASALARRATIPVPRDVRSMQKSAVFGHKVESRLAGTNRTARFPRARRFTGETSLRSLPVHCRAGLCTALHLPACGLRPARAYRPCWRRGRVAEGGGLPNPYRVLKA